MTHVRVSGGPGRWYWACLEDEACPGYEEGVGHARRWQAALDAALEHARRYRLA